MRSGHKSEVITGEFIEVANLFQAFHINYVINSYTILKRLDKEFDITKHEFFILSCIYDLVRCSPNRTRKTNNSVLPSLPSHGTILPYVESLIRKGRLTAFLRQMTEKHLIRIVSKGGKKGNVMSARIYDLDYNGYLVTRRYATLMSELYRDNYYSKQAKRKVSAANKLQAKLIS